MNVVRKQLSGSIRDEESFDLPSHSSCHYIRNEKNVKWKNNFEYKVFFVYESQLVQWNGKKPEW